MDLQWRLAQRRQWIELGYRERLTYRELARRARVSERTIRRWCVIFREEAESHPMVVTSVQAGDPPQPVAGIEEPRQEDAVKAIEPEPPDVGSIFAEVVQTSGPAAGEIQIELAGGNKIVIAGPLDIESLGRVIGMIRQC